MTISVDGLDSFRFNDGRTYCVLDVWASKDSQTNAGRLAIIFRNEHTQFQQDICPLFKVPNQYTKSLSGTIFVEGSPAARVARCYRRSDGHFVAETVSNAGTGAYAFNNLNPAEEYFVIPFDDDAAPDFNALILDRGVPV